MVKQITENNQTYYVCMHCDFAYKDKATAARCEQWCRRNKSCNPEITKFAVER